MSVRSLPNDEHLLDLLALRAAEGLDPADEAAVSVWDDVEVFDEAAAVLAVGLLGPLDADPMPAGLRARLENLADQVAATPTRNATGFTGPSEPAPLRLTPSPAVNRSVPNSSPSRPLSGLVASLGWLAAAACLAFAVVVWSGSGGRASVLTPEQQLVALESRPGVVKTDWLGLDDAGLADAPHSHDRNLVGRVVWDPATNEGCMVFEGLAGNDPKAFQYQLWIFDADRPTGHLPQFGEGILSQRPVDGGVFDIPSNGRVVVPIRAKLPVGQARIFAVTVEPPGGVVVSDRDVVTLAVVN